MRINSLIPPIPKKLDANIFNAIVHTLMRESEEFERVHTWSSSRLPETGEPIRENISRTKDGIRYYVNSHALFSQHSAPSLAKAMYVQRKLHSEHPNTTIVFAHCGVAQLQEKLDFIRIERMQLWDLPTLVLRFYTVLDALPRDFFKSYMLEVHSSVMENLEHFIPFYADLKKIRPGKEEWSVYQNQVKLILDLALNPPLTKSYYEDSDGIRQNRRDIVFPNYAIDGFWKHVRDEYRGTVIVIEVKNYTNSICKNEVLTTGNYLNAKGVGLFSIIVTRKGASKSASHAVRNEWLANGKMIVVLDDQDLFEMLKFRIIGRNPESVIRKKIERFRLDL